MQACAIEPEVRYFRTSKSDLSRVFRSRPLVKGNEDAGYEGGTAQANHRDSMREQGLNYGVKGSYLSSPDLFLRQLLCDRKRYILY